MNVGHAPGTRIARYVLAGRVGAGGMAEVYLARDSRLGRQVALKVLGPPLSEDQEFRQRFIRESRATAALDDPHIIPVYEAGESDGVLYIAMRYVSGGNVQNLVKAAGPLPPARATAILSPVASALDVAHRHGLVHRDVKPANMLIDTQPGRPDHVYLSDFGILKSTQESVKITGTGVALGTLAYCAPEQLDGQAVDGRADQYALGCSAFELLSGAPPFLQSDTRALLNAHFNKPPPALSARRAGMPGAADAVLARALAKDPGARYGSCQEFAEALREALGLAPYIAEFAQPPRPGPTQTVPRQRQPPRPVPQQLPLPAPAPEIGTHLGQRTKQRSGSPSTRRLVAGVATVIALMIGIPVIAYIVSRPSYPSRVGGWRLAAEAVGGGGTAVDSVSCPSAQLCVAVDAQGNAYVDRNSTWSGPVAVDSALQGESGTTEISCSSQTSCVGLDILYGSYFTWNGSRWSAARQIAGSSSYVIGLSCPTATFCMAVGDEGAIYQFNGRTWRFAEPADNPALAAAALNEISCVSPRFCLATSYTGHYFLYRNGRWNHGAPLPSTVTPRALTCASASYCWITASPTRGKGAVLRYDGRSWSVAIVLDVSSELSAISCPAVGTCVAADQDGRLLFLHGSSWSAPLTAESSVAVKDISCASTRSCVFVGAQGMADTISR